MHVKAATQTSGAPLSSWLVLYPSAALVAAALPVSLLREGSQRLALLADAAAVAVVAYAFFIESRGRSGRPLSLVGLLVLLGLMMRTGPLLVSSLLGVSPEYEISTGVYSYDEGAWLVALIRAVFTSSVVLAALLVRRYGNVVTNGTRVADRLDDQLLDGLCGGAIVVTLVSFLLLFTTDQASNVLAYSGRIFAAYLLPLIFFGGVALRRERVTGFVLLAVALGTSALLLLAGSRGGAILPLVLLGIGCAAGKVTAARTLWVWLAGLAPVLFVAMFLGGQLRGDQKARNGQSALEHIGDVSNAFDQVNQDNFANTTLLRLVSASDHAIMTRVPSELPFEKDGLSGIPVDLVSGFLPKFALEAKSDAVPRHWILNDLGFALDWNNSAELTLIADAWLRGGFLGVILVGILIGTILQMCEDSLYRRISKDAVWFVPLVFAAVGIRDVEVSGIADGLRQETFYLLSGIAVVLLSGYRRRVPGLPGIHSAS